MKLNKIFAAFMLFGAVAFAACGPVIPEPDGPGNGGKDTTKTDSVAVVAIPEMDIPAEAITVAEARTICEGLESGATTGTKYYVKGWVKKIASNHASGVSGYGNGQFYMADNQYVDGTFDKDDFVAFQVYYLDGKRFEDPEQVQVGDYVVVYGELTNHNGTYETVGKGAAYISHTNNPRIPEGPVVGEIDYLPGELSVSEFLDLDVIKNLKSGDTTTDSIVVRGYVKANPQVALDYGNANFYITDGEKELYCYQTYALNNEKFVSGKQLQEGDIVTVKGLVTNYNGTIEPKRGYIVRTTNTFDPSTITIEEITIEQVIELGNTMESGQLSDGQYKIAGFVVGEPEVFTTQYGTATFKISSDPADETNAIECYRLKYLDNKKWAEGQPQLNVGDQVTVIGQLKKDGSKMQVASGYISEHIQ